MGAQPNSVADVECVSLRAEVDALTTQLLTCFEEVTLLYDLAQDMGVVVDVEKAAGTALARILQVIPATLGMVLIGPHPELLESVASYGDIGADGSRCLVARESAAVALERGVQVMVHAEGSIRPGGAPAEEPVLATPLFHRNKADAGMGAHGVVVFVGHDGSDRFSAGEAQLGAVVASQLAHGVENAHLISQLREKERLESEVALAAQMQRSLLPPRAPILAQASLAAVCLPAAQVGGDYFDFVTGLNGAVDVVVADVTGHGLGPGLIMAMTRSVLRAQLRGPSSLPGAMGATASMMWDDLVSTEAFITVFAARFDPTLRLLRYVNGGHHPALLRRRDGSIEELTSEGMPFGLISSPSYEENSRVLEPGDVVLIFSDGLVEANAPDGTEFGTPRLRELLAKSRPCSADDLVTDVLAALRRFLEEGPQEDDVTIAALIVQGDLDRDRMSWGDEATGAGRGSG